MATSAAAHHEPSKSEIRMVIAASSAGTVFEWYDFFIYGTLAALIGKAFFPADNETLSTLLVWAGFAVGFGFRPLGAILFGFLGDRLGRKYTFLVTVTLMGVATAGVGFVPSAENIGLAAPLIVLVLRIAQGLALGGEYGGAAVYVAEHAPPDKRGLYTSFIQASVVGGFVLSILVVITCRFLIPPEDFAAWGWRLPFILSLALLAVSLWMRLKLSESPVFEEMKAAGEISGNPFVQSFTYPGNHKRIFVALFGVTGILTTVWYTAYFSSMSFLRGPMRLDENVVELLMLVTGLVSMVFYVLVGKWSDKVGRKLPIVLGAALTLLLLFPFYWGLGALANPGLASSARAEPVVVMGEGCSYDPFADRQQTECGRLLADLTALGVSYDVRNPEGAARIIIGGEQAKIAMADEGTRKAAVRSALEARGYSFAVQRPPLTNLLAIGVLLLGLGALSALTFGSVAAVLTEMFPPQIRYSSLSIPYHIGAGYLGGFLPLIAAYIVATTGNAYAGLWYTIAVVAFGLLVALWGLKGGPPRDFSDDHS